MNFDYQNIYVVLDDQGNVITSYTELDEEGYYLIENSGLKVVTTTLWTPRTGK